MKKKKSKIAKKHLLQQLRHIKKSDSPHTVTLISLLPPPHPSSPPSRSPPPPPLIISPDPHVSPSAFLLLLSAHFSLAENSQFFFLSITCCPQQLDTLDFFPLKKKSALFSSIAILWRLVLFSHFHHPNSLLPICWSTLRNPHGTNNQRYGKITLEPARNERERERESFWVFQCDTLDQWSLV